MKTKELIKNTLEKTNLYKPAKKAKEFVSRKYNRAKYLMSPEYKEFQRRRALYSSLINKGDLVFDIGANVGNRTEVLLNIGARVVAVEPQANCVRILNDKFGNNENFVLFEGGMDQKAGETVIHIADVDTISSMNLDWINSVKNGVFKENSWNRQEKVKVDTLDNLIIQHGVPHLIKVDVEGFEINVLKGLTQKVGCISYEFMFPEFYNQALECLEYIESIAPVECNYSWGETMKLVERKWVPSSDFREILSDAKKNAYFGDIYVRFL